MKTAYIYLGPNVKGGILFNGAVYKQFPKHLDTIFEKVPELKNLFVEINKSAMFKQALQRKETEESRIYRSAMTELNNL